MQGKTFSATSSLHANLNASTAVQALVAMYDKNTGSTLKEVEHQHFDGQIPANQAFFIRLDGCTFSTFLKGVVKPFDSRISDAMLKTTGDLVEKFNARLGYTSSDEISLVFASVADEETKAETEAIYEEVTVEGGKPLATQEVDNNKVEKNDSSKKRESSSSSGDGRRKGNQNQKSKRMKVEKTHGYNGRLQKWASVSAGYASARFNYHLSHPENQWDDMTEGGVKARMLSGIAHFDARVVPVADPKTIMETIYWRSNFDAFRNSISQISAAQFSKKALHGLSVIEQLVRLSKEKDMDILNDYHKRYLFGSWVKKQHYNIEAVNLKTGEPVTATRTRLACASLNWADWSEQERIQFTMAKYWPVNEMALKQSVNEDKNGKLSGGVVEEVVMERTPECDEVYTKLLAKKDHHHH